MHDSLVKDVTKTSSWLDTQGTSVITPLLFEVLVDRIMNVLSETSENKFPDVDDDDAVILKFTESLQNNINKRNAELTL